MLRLLHTSDWHLGHQLHDLSREAEHAAFLAWLLERVEEHEVDALLIAGDVFHTANPSAAATRQWYDFLAAAGDRFPALEVIAIAGNHDSAGRIEAPAPLLPPRHTIVGRTHRREGGDLDLERMLVPVRDARGNVAAWVLAVPFLRPQDLPPDPQARGVDYLVQGTRRVYRELANLARTRARPGQPIVAMGHLHMISSSVSEGSERRVFGGAEHVPAEAFPPTLAYVALGHLHRPQKVSGQRRLRYAGSPIPLSMDEDTYPHQVVLVELDGNALAGTHAISVPRTVDLLRLPSAGPRPLADVLAELESLPDIADEPCADWPFLEVRVLLTEPSPSLRHDVEQAIAGKAVRLVRIAVQYPAPADSAAGDATEPARELAELEPRDLFGRMWSETHGSEPSEQVKAAFRELVDAAGQCDEGGP